MQGQPEAEKWVSRLGIAENTLLLPFLPQADLWALYQHAAVYVSLSSHDGTPNSFLEAIARGCFPVVGRIPSLSEWVADGANGFLVNPRDPDAAASAVLTALEGKPLRDAAARKNMQLIHNRADRAVVRDEVLNFYQGLIKKD